jgi:hypothetical protein
MFFSWPILPQTNGATSLMTWEGHAQEPTTNKYNCGSEQQLSKLRDNIDILGSLIKTKKPLM